MAEPSGTPRRRLPVINAPAPRATPGEPDDEERPPWQWIGFGVVAIFAAWLPFAYGAQALTARVLASRYGATTADELAVTLAAMPEAERVRLGAWLALPHVLALGIAAFAGGLLVGRFGARTTVREAGSAGLCAALIALALSVRDAGVSVTSLVTLVVATVFAGWGGAVGARLRRRAGGSST